MVEFTQFKRHSRRFWFYLYLCFILLMSLVTLKINIGFEIRFSQIFLLFLSSTVILYDLKNRVFNFKIYLFFLFFGILLSLISLTSVYEKIGEFKFFIKYIIIYPLAFYLGYRISFLLKEKEIIKMSELAILFASGMAIFLYFHPIHFLIHDRGALTGFQGTFWETSGLGIYVAVFLLISFILRLYNNYLSFKYIIFTIFSLSIILFTKTKIVFLALFIIPMIAVIYKGFIYSKNFNYNFLFLNKINSTRILIFLSVFIASIIIYNNSIEHPFISIEIIQNKLENERGKVLKAAIELLEDSNWLGSYGFGFVERYFTTFYRDTAIGVGEGVNAIFNSFLDVWISVGLLGVLFHLIILKLAFSTKHFLTIALPIFFLLVGNTGPIFISYEYYFFMGFSYGFKKYLEFEELKN